MPTTAKFTLAFAATHLKLLGFDGSKIVIMTKPSAAVNGQSDVVVSL
jgi:hypothetical protein